jgi:hypothetical protein
MPDASAAPTGPDSGQPEITTPATDIPVTPFDVARKSLRGDVRDHLVEFLKVNKDGPWPQMSEAKQEAVVERADSFARQLVDDLVDTVMADATGADPIRCELKKVESGGKGKVKVVLEATFDAEMWLRLGQLANVYVVPVNHLDYGGERRSMRSHVTPDQGRLRVDGTEVPPPPAQDDPRADEKPIMDQTTTGERIAAERGGGRKGRKGAKPDGTDESGKARPVLIADGTLTDDGYREMVRTVRSGMTSKKIGYEGAVADVLRNLEPFRSSAATIDRVTLAAVFDNSYPDVRVAIVDTTTEAPTAAAQWWAVDDTTGVLDAKSTRRLAYEVIERIDDAGLSFEMALKRVRGTHKIPEAAVFDPTVREAVDALRKEQAAAAEKAAAEEDGIAFA